MYTSCDEVFKLTIPAVRISVAKVLKRKYGMNQLEIARALGITQAAASKYLSGRHSAKIIKLEKLIHSKKLDDQVATEIKKDRRSASKRFDELASSGFLVSNAMKIL